MTQLEEFCKKLRTLAVIQEKAHRPAVVRRLREAAEMLERCYEILNFEGPDGRYRDELNDLAAKALKQEPR